ncbi:MAG: hypothetical protein LDL53_08690 [Candidatus Hydrogenedens sp.]|nr:hypothetical protein [Candidatus Hydrogenedens sp.]
MNTFRFFSKVMYVSLVFNVMLLFLGLNGYGVIYISNIEDLKNIGNDPFYPLDGKYKLTQDIDALDTINWNDGAGFAPIGNDTNPFTGVFDGRGHKIRNLYINRPSQDYVGLFGYVGEGGEVKNVGLENVQMVGSLIVGGLVGWNEGTVSESYSTGSVAGNYYVGGLVGVNAEGAVVQSYSTGSVVGDFAVGGLVATNSGAVVQSYSTGSASGGDYVGGLVGANAYAVTQSYSTGSVSGKQYVGGLVGYNEEGTVSQSYSTGSVSGSDYLGGLVGMNFEGTVSQSYSMGSVEGVFGVGGLVGWNGGTVTQSYSTGSASGEDCVGGLVGATDYAVKQSYSTGSVVGNSNVGGLIGYNDGGSTTQSYWDTETSGQNSSAGGEGKTTAEMKQKITYTNWDFNCVWNIEEGITYPYLRWERGEVPEGCESTTEGVEEGEGSKEGGVEGVKEGEGSKEGSVDGAKEGEGETGADKTPCGCNKKSMDKDSLLKCVLDFILVGMLMFTISGMQKRK